MRTTVYVVDGPYLTYRAYCAGGTDAMRNSTISVLLDLALHGEVWCVWERTDGKGCELRREIYPAYKARREEKPPEYLQALTELQDMLATLGIGQAWPEEGEADDAAMTLTCDWLDAGHGVQLWGRDKDWFQILPLGSVTMYLPPINGMSGGKVISAADVLQILGIPAYLVPDYLALAGDASDDVPGMPRIGSKRAVALLAACPRIVQLLLEGGDGDRAVATVAATDAALAPYAQACADHTDLLRQMHALVVLREVSVTRRPGAFDRKVATGALTELGCGWALSQLGKIGTDDWEDTSPSLPPVMEASGELDDWGE